MPDEDPELLWQNCLADLVSEAATIDGVAPLQWFSDKGDDGESWVLMITPSVLRDSNGGVVFASWRVDLSSILDLFQCEPEPEVMCSAVDTTISGVFEGHSVLLVLLWSPPGDAQPIGELRADGSVTFSEDPCEGCTGCDDIEPDEGANEPLLN